MRSSWYAVLGIGFAVLWPLALDGKISRSAVGILIVLCGNTVLFAAYGTTSRHLSYFRGLDIISASFMSGCANITFLYILPVLFVMQMMALLYSIIGIFAGRLFSQTRWAILVNAFYERRTGQSLPALESFGVEP